MSPDFSGHVTATARACEAVGWGYERVGVLDPVFAANLRWLSGYRHRRYHQSGWADRLRQVFTQPAELLDGVTAVGDPLGVLPVLFHLLWCRELRTDLRSAPLGEKTLVWAAGGQR